MKVLCAVHFVFGELHETPKRWYVLHDGRRCVLAAKSDCPRFLLKLFMEESS